MLTKIRIQNFKQFDDVEIELGPVTVLIGPNNSGKTTVLQALMLWYLGLEYLDDILDSAEHDDGAYLESFFKHRRQKINWSKQAIIPVASLKDLWPNTGAPTDNLGPIIIEVSGISNLKGISRPWQLGFDFTFSDEKTLFCNHHVTNPRDTSYIQTYTTLMPSISDIVPIEREVDSNEIEALILQGRSSEVIRNICLQLYKDQAWHNSWQKTSDDIKRIFNIELLFPGYQETIIMTYRNRIGKTFDISAAGKGVLQMLILLRYAYRNLTGILLLDNPESHLDVSLQREAYRLIVNDAKERNLQVIIATHSEAIVNDAREKEIIVKLGNKTHRIDNYTKG